MPNDQQEDRATKDGAIAFGEAFRVWLRIALLSFGGPAGQIALMHRVLVDEKKWISESRFLHALNYCMLLPGPEAQQLATYVGWLFHKTWGGLVAGILFILPGAIVILALSVLYAGFNDLSIVQAVFFGIKAAVLAVVVEAVLRIGKRALTNRVMYAIAAAAFIAIFFFAAPFPVIVIAAALFGYIGGRAWPHVFAGGSGHGDGGGTEDDAIDALSHSGQLAHTKPSTARAVRVAAICLTLWLAPIALLMAGLGMTHVYTQESLFFSKMAVVTFGGAYAVLAYVAQQAVATYGWLAPGEMLDGLGMAETTPGPLIMVVQFVGFMGAYRNPGALDPMLAGVLGAAITTLGDVRAVLPVDFPGRALHRGATRQQIAERGAVDHHRRHRRRGPEPRPVVCDPRGVRDGRSGPAGHPAALRAGVGHRQYSRAYPDSSRAGGHVAL